MPDPFFWMVANGFITLLNVACVIVLIIHLYIRRDEFSWGRHGFSVAVSFYLFGELIFHVLYWKLWSNFSINQTPNHFARLVIETFEQPVVKFATIFNLIGMMMLIYILTFRVFWIVVVVTSAALSVLLAWLNYMG
jgi:hypothetical protein